MSVVFVHIRAQFYSSTPIIQAMASHSSSVVFFFLLLFFFHGIPTSSTITDHGNRSEDQKFDLLQEEQISHFQQYLRICTAHPTPDYTTAVSFLTSLAELTSPSTIRTFEFSPGKPLFLITYLGSSPSLPSILFNSHIDSVPAEAHKWVHPPFSAVRDSKGRIFARGAQDDKCIGIQYLEALRVLRSDGFVPVRTIHISFVPDEEIGGKDGAESFSRSEEFKKLNVGFVMDEGQASPTDEFRVFYADRTPWKLILKARGAPGHGSKLFDGSALENLMEAMEDISRFRDSQFDLVKSGKLPASEVISFNPIYMKAGTQSTTGFLMNMQPSEGEAGFDIRLPPTADPDRLKERIAEWAPSIKNLTCEVMEEGPIRDYAGRPLATATNGSNIWWNIFKQAITASGGKLAKPEVLASTTDARFTRQMGIPTLGFSPMSNTPILLHEHNEFLQDSVFLRGIQVYTHVIRALSSSSHESATARPV